MFGKVNEDSLRDIFDSSLFLSEDRSNVSSGSSNNRSSSLLFPSSPSSSSSSDCSENIFGLSGHQQQQSKRNTRMPFQVGCIGDNRKTKNSFPDNCLALDLQNLNNNLNKSNNNNNGPSSPSHSSSGSSVSSQQQQQQQKVNPNRYKTELCRPFQENGVCKYGEKCQFAHGNVELRSVSRHPKYKTDLCRTYHSVGFCPYGPRCHFIHNLEEVKPNSAPVAVATPVKGVPVTPAAPPASAMPPLPMFSNTPQLTREQVSRLGGGERLRNPSESGYTSSGSSSSSSSSFGGDSENSFSRLPVFSTLSK